MERGAVNIVLGAIVFAVRDASLLGFLRSFPFVLYQLEQLKSDAGLLADNPAYATLLESAVHVLEYSPAGLRFLQGTPAAAKSSLLPPAFHRSLETFRPGPVRDIDVLFYGSSSARRTALREALRSRGVNVVKLFGVYGDALVEQIRRAKIVLNVHAYPELNVLETVRLTHLLANRCFVVSEAGDHNPYGDGVAYADYDDLVDTCLAYLGDQADQRDVIATQGYLAVRRTDFVTDLRTALAQLPIDRLTAGR